MSLTLREDVDYNGIVIAAYELCDFVIDKYKIHKYADFQCPFFKALAKELYMEDDDGSNG